MTIYRFRTIVRLVLLVFTILLSFQSPSIEASPSSMTLIGNPAALYCTEIMGYEYEIIEDFEGAQRGLCILPDGEACNQWDFYAGICGQEHNYCSHHGYQTETREDGQDSFAPRYAVCVTSDAHVMGAVSQLSRLSVRATESCFGTQLDIDLAELPISPPKEVNSTLPPSIDWRNFEGADWLTSVKDQASCGSCWAFAAVGVAEAYHNISTGNPNLDLDLAEQHLVSCSNTGDCGGGVASFALGYIRDEGIVDEGCIAYTASDSPCSLCSDWQSRLTHLDAVYRFVPNRDTIRESVVAHGPLYVSMGIADDYGGYFDEDGIYRCSNDSQNGNMGTNHAVVIVGYDDVNSYWIVKNSWGSSFNGDGYFKVGYGECNIDSTYAAYTYKVPMNKIYLPLTLKNYSPSAPTPINTLNCRIRFHGRTTTDPSVGGHDVYVRAVIRKSDGTILYEGDDLTVVSGTTPEEDYGTLTLNGLSNIVVGQPYELLITGAMHLTRKWTVTFDTANPLLDLTAADDLLWSGDFNADNRVDYTDYEIFIDVWAAVYDGTPIDPELVYKADLNGNGELAGEDYGLFLDSYENGPGIGDQ